MRAYLYNDCVELKCDQGKTIRGRAEGVRRHLNFIVRQKNLQLTHCL